MSNRNLLNLSLLIFILVLVIFVVYEPGKEVAITPPTLTTLDSKEIFHIKITRYNTEIGKEEIEFKKTPSGWNMLKPYAVSANAFRIDSILELLSTVSFSQNNLKNLNLDTFGLTQPVATITFNNKTAIAFGHNKSLKNHRYVQINSTLHMISDTFYYQLAVKSESYISHKLLSEKNKIQKLSLPTMKFEKVDGMWISKPKTNDFSADSINQLISEWQLSQAYDINKVKINPNSKPDIVIQLENHKKLQFKIETSKDNFNLVNLNSGIRYILSADRKDKLLKLSNITQDD